MTHNAAPTGMRIDWDVEIPTRDGTILRADVFAPGSDGRWPVLLTHGPYGKGLSFQSGFPGMWRVIEERHPDVLAGSSNRYQVWETPDPEKWVPHNYVCVRVDSRGAGRSPGFLDIFSRTETEDFYDCIEWAGVQEWSNGRVGLLGVSYYAMNQWQVAALRPPHLAAICPWEGASDYYREFVRHGGILSTFFETWYPATILRVQHGLGERGERSDVTGELISGPETQSDDELRRNRPDWLADIRAHTFDDGFHAERTPDLGRIEVPLLSAANWAHHLHTRGNFAGYEQAASPHKWLEVHGLEHWVHFYTDYGVSLQRQFFDRFLKDADNGWDDRAPVTLNLRRVDGSFEERQADRWPPAEMSWRRLALTGSGGLAGAAIAEDETVFEVPASSSGLTFLTEPFDRGVELTGPSAATLFVSTDDADVDVFVTVRVFDSDGADVTFRSALDPQGIVTAGWLRGSHRETDAARSAPARPFHPHDRAVPLNAGEVHELAIEIWPTSVILPPGYRLGLTISTRDFAFEGGEPWPQLYGVPMRGQAIFLHDDPTDRPAHTYGRPFRVHVGGRHPSSLLIPLRED